MRVKDGTVYVLDVNALPGIIPDPEENSRFPTAARAAGLSYEEILNSVVYYALKRYGMNIPNEYLGLAEKLRKISEREAAKRE